MSETKCPTQRFLERQDEKIYRHVLLFLNSLYSKSRDAILKETGARIRADSWYLSRKYVLEASVENVAPLDQKQGELRDRRL
jgi:hypothetical protein